MKECDFCHDEVADDAKCGSLQEVGDVCGCCGRTLIAKKAEPEEKPETEE